MVVYLKNPASGLGWQLVFTQLWRTHPSMLQETLEDFYNDDEENLGRVVDIALELRVSQTLMAKAGSR
jgi:CCR4-NOT transcription complex subunit 1